MRNPITITSSAPIEGNMRTLFFDPETEETMAFHVQYDPVARFLAIARYQASDDYDESEYITITREELDRINQALAPHDH